ncbi:MAG TPA: metallophosphoesterase [Kiritimatiellia bacterium]|nr:metallophosphoesterase [Kiritimatiellia bacterium]HRU70646.1 metallophosphoesterase [Kiritimatiellia bacterium]
MKKVVTVVAMLVAFAAAAEEPALRFGFLTDTHIDAEGSNLDRVRKALTLFKTNNVDLVVHGGDICNAFYPGGYAAYSNCFEEVFADAVAVPRKIYAVGNHDTQNNLGEMSQIDAAAEVLRILGAENLHTDKRTVNGYTLLVMPYALGDTAQGFLSWEEYEAAVSNACEEAGAGRPVFVLEHKPPQSTVYNTASEWGYRQSREILMRYPQVVELSGHVHGSLYNDVFFWQGEFSVVNACCLQQWYGLLDGKAATTGKTSNGVLLVDVFTDKIVISRWDALDGTEIGPDHRWQINLPHAEATALFNRTHLVTAEQANPPAFNADAVLTVNAVTSGQQTTGYTLTFPQVTDNAMTYWIEARTLGPDGVSWVEAAHTEIFSDYWKSPSERSDTVTYTFPANDLAVSTTYRFAVQPVGQYATKGAAITAEVTTPPTLIIDTPDMFIEYVEATGGQYVDTKVIGRSGTKAEIEISIDPSYIGGDRAILDVRKDDGPTRFYPFHSSAGFAAYGYAEYYRQDAFGALKGDYRYLMESELRAGRQTLMLNGQTVTNATITETVDTSANLYLFACNHVSTSAKLYPIRAKCYGLKIWQTATMGADDTDYKLVRDFKPCVTAGVAGLYDTVSRRIFYGDKTSGASSAALALPADWTKWGTAVPGKPDYFVDYVESNGRQVLDTGVRARTGVKAEAEIRWMNETDEQTFLGATVNNDAGFYMMHLVNGRRMWTAYGSTRTYFDDPGTGTTALWAGGVYNKVTVDFSHGAQSITRNGTNVWSLGSEQMVDLGCTITAFAVRRFGLPYYWSRVRCRGLKMWLDGELVRDYRPCVKGGRPGLYDTVNDEVCFPAGEAFYGRGAPLHPEGFPGSFADYVEATGGQYVDLRVRGRSGTKAEMDMMYTGNASGDTAYIGARKDSGATRVYLLHRAFEAYSYGYGSFKYISAQNQNLFADYVRHMITSELRWGCQKIVVDGQTLCDNSDMTVYDTGVNFYLFAVNFEGAKYHAKARSYGLKIWQTPTTNAYDTAFTLVRDLRPCAYHDGINVLGALYDRVTGEILGQSSGLTLPSPAHVVPGKPDAFVAYIESNGSQLLDTGVRAATGVKAEGEFMWLENKAEATYLGMYAGNRMYMVHKVGTRAWAAYGDDVGRHYLTNVVTGVKAQYAPGTKEHFVVDYGASSQTITLNGTNVYSEALATPVDGGGTLGLFAVRNGRNVRSFSASARCYNLNLWTNGVLARAFLPCVKDGKGALYDAVNDEMAFPDGHDITGALIGPITNVTAFTPKRYIDYIAADADNWLDTGVVAKSGTKAELVFTGVWGDGSSYLGNNAMGLLGARGALYGENAFCLAHVTNGVLASTYGTFGCEATAVITNVRHTVVADFAAGAQTVALDGTPVWSGQVAGAIDTGLNLYLFAINDRGVAAFPARARVHSLKIWQDGALVRDYRPVMTQEGIPVFWDKVNNAITMGARLFTDYGSDLGTIKSGMQMMVR